MNLASGITKAISPLVRSDCLELRIWNGDFFDPRIALIFSSVIMLCSFLKPRMDADKRG